MHVWIGVYYYIHSIYTFYRYRTALGDLNVTFRLGGEFISVLDYHVTRFGYRSHFNWYGTS